MANKDEPLDSTTRGLMWGVAGYALGMLVTVSVAAYVKYRGLDPLLTLLLPIPFGAGGLVAGTLHRRSPLASSVAVLLAALSLSALYVRSFARIECLMIARKWTAASLSLGFLPFVGLLVAGIAGSSAFVVAAVIGAVWRGRA
jgi:hypothetical protein